MIEIIEKLHETGYVYNDIKPDNICVGIYNKSNTDHKLKLIDFGLSTRYLDLESKEHI